jgi:NADPH-dependent 2,4-dienoyl-CoA reductase/sulfur reductase-like enzyme
MLSLPAALAGLSLSLPRGLAAAPHRVVVVGGGFAGSTVAKYLRMWSDGGIAVTLIEPGEQHVSCIMSNLVLNGQLSVADLSFGYAALSGKYGVDVVRDRALAIDGENQRLQLMNGGLLAYDSLVVATGIGFDPVDGLDTRKTPHAWIAGPQTSLLRQQIRDMPDDGTFVMTIPQAPYRCPPGPYERACLVADILGRRSGILGDGGRSGTGAPRVVVLDANPGIQAERETFSRAFQGLYGDIVEYLPDATVVAVDSDAREVSTTRGTYRGDLLNVIPRHSAHRLLTTSGLTGTGRWASVDPVTYGSILQDFPGVYVIGDAQGTGQPKSGHMANSQAKICADAILRSAAGLSPYTEERLNNLTTNSACFSPITRSEASWLTAVFRYDRAAGAMTRAPGSLGEAHRWNSENYRDMFDWSSNLFADTFG